MGYAVQAQEGFVHWVCKLLKITLCFYFALKSKRRNIGGQYFAASRFPAIPVPVNFS